MSIFKYRKCETNAGRGKFFGTVNRLPTIEQSQGAQSTYNSGSPDLTVVCCIPNKGADELVNDKFFSGKNRFGKVLKETGCTEANSFGWNPYF